MAISATHFELLSRLKPILPRGGSLLEIGEANWYGDIKPAESLSVLWQALTEPEKAAIGQKVNDYLYGTNANQFSVVKALYAILFNPRRMVAVDMNGTPEAWRHDLNAPLPPMGEFDVIINHGTAEHIFDIAQVFKSMHDACKPGGLMIHEAPFTGWLDHGFYCLQPTLFYDLAAANGYCIVSVAVEEIQSRQVIDVESREAMTALLPSVPNNAMLYVVLQKVADAPFMVPMQGIYNQTLSEAGRQAWESLR